MSEVLAIPTVRDLLDTVIRADATLRTARDSEWNDANEAHHAAEQALVARLVQVTGLTSEGVAQLGGFI